MVEASTRSHCRTFRVRDVAVISGLTAVMFLMTWIVMTVMAIASTASNPAVRPTTDGAFGFSAQEWNGALGSTWTKAAIYTGLVLLTCVVVYGIGTLRRRLLRTETT